MRKDLSKYLIQVGTLLLLIGIVGATLTGCTVVVNSENVTTATDVTNAVLGGL